MASSICWTTCAPGCGRRRVRTTRNLWRGSIFLAPDSFVRRLRATKSLLEATETHFDGVARTYDRVCEYVRRYQEDDDSGAFYASLLTRRDLDLFLERRILAAASVCGSVTLEETELECSKIEALEPDLPRSSYLRFVASLIWKGISRRPRSSP